MRLWRNVAVFVAVATVYVCCPVKGISDLIWSIPTAFSVIREGNADLDEYQPSFAQLGGHGVLQVGGHYRNYFPMGSTLVELAPLWLFNQAVDAVEPLARHAPALARGVRNWQHNFARVGNIDLSFFVVTEMVLASLFMALAAVFIQAMAAERLPWSWALVVTGAFALGSPVFSTASRDMGQHGPSVLMLSIALWLLVRARRAPRCAALAALFVASSYLMRPTNSLSVIALTLWVAIRHRRQLPVYCALGALVAAPFLVYNLSVYGAALPPYYQPERIVPASASLMLEALAGNLVSPARGLFIFSPIFLFSGYGLFLELSSERRIEALLVTGLIATHWLVVSSFAHWWGGHSYGPRFMTDLAPYLCYLLVPVVQRFARLERTEPLPRWLIVAAVAAAAWSGFTHVRGATSMAVAEWNARPIDRDVDAHPERLWDFTDPSFLRGL